MNYFTRELIEMGQSSDPSVLNRQEELWDAACERYFNQLEALKSEMPPGLWRIVESYYLHDALVQGMGGHGNTFVIHLQLDTPPQSLLTFSYQLVEDPSIDREALAEQYRSSVGPVQWQHDEIEREEGAASIWRQAILFSNGWVVRLRFREVSVQEVPALLPAPRGGQDALPAPTIHQEA